MILTEMMDRLEQRESRMIEIRRYLHAHPELSFEETQTAKYIEDFYKNVPIDKIDTHISGQNGIVVTIKGSKPGKTIAIRADFDALPIEEETGLPFASKNPGVMHACGHDGHTAYMMILTETLAEMKEELVGTIKVIHQPGEEKSPGGAVGIIHSGNLQEKPGCFFYVGASPENGKVYPHHNPKFEINEKSLLISAKAMAAAVLSYCGPAQ